MYSMFIENMSITNEIYSLVDAKAHLQKTSFKQRLNLKKLKLFKKFSNI